MSSSARSCSLFRIGPSCNMTPTAMSWGRLCHPAARMARYLLFVVSISGGNRGLDQARLLHQSRIACRRCGRIEPASVDYHESRWRGTISSWISARIRNLSADHRHHSRRTVFRGGYADNRPANSRPHAGMLLNGSVRCCAFDGVLQRNKNRRRATTDFCEGDQRLLLVSRVPKPMPEMLQRQNCNSLMPRFTKNFKRASLSLVVNFLHG